MVPEIVSSGIYVIEGAMYQGNFSYIIDPKLRSSYNVILFSPQGILVFYIDPICIINVCSNFNALLVRCVGDTRIYVG